MQVIEHEIQDLGIPIHKLTEGDTFYGQLCRNAGGKPAERCFSGSNRLLCLLTDCCVVVLNAEGQTWELDLLSVKDYVPVRVLCTVEEIEAAPNKRKRKTRQGRGGQLEL